MYEVILKRFDRPDEVRIFEKGKFELVHLGGLPIVHLRDSSSSSAEGGFGA